VVVVDPATPVPDRFRTAPFAAALAEADVVFPLVASTPETEGLIDAEAIAAMPAGSILVNVSRGEIVDDTAVADALDRGHLRAFACDVGTALDQRPDPVLAARPDVVATPHLGGLTPENADAQARSSVEQIAALLRGEQPPRLANPEVWQPR
jgi:D-3-phosphoglycerate dehydrogenase